MASIRIFLATASFSLALGVGAAVASSTKPLSPAKAVKVAESKLKDLIRNGEDRPSVYEGRIELVQALRALGSCDTRERIDRELQAVTAWIERMEVPVRLSPQLVYNELGRVAQTHADCTEDESQQKSQHEAALRAFTLARQAAKQNFDALNEAVVLYNASQSAEALGDLPRAIALMEEACAIDLEYALYDNYREDYVELVRMRDAHSGTETPSGTVEQHLASVAREKIRFSFKPVHGDQQRYRSDMQQLTLTNGQRQERKLEMQYTGVVALKDDLVTVTIQPGESKVNGRDARLVAAEYSQDVQAYEDQDHVHAYSRAGRASEDRAANRARRTANPGAQREARTGASQAGAERGRKAGRGQVSRSTHPVASSRCSPSRASNGQTALKRSWALAASRARIETTVTVFARARNLAPGSEFSSGHRMNQPSPFVLEERQARIV